MGELMCTTESHEAAKREAWSSLIFIGIWELIPGEPQAIANCPHCRSTLMRDATAEDLAREEGRVS